MSESTFRFRFFSVATAALILFVILFPPVLQPFNGFGGRAFILSGLWAKPTGLAPVLGLERFGLAPNFNLTLLILEVTLIILAGSKLAGHRYGFIATRQL